MTNFIAGRRVISMDKIRGMEAFTATNAHSSRSDKYSQIPTIEIVDLLMAHGWHPVQVSQSNIRQADREGFQKHMVRMTNPDFHLGEEMLDLVLLNSHDGSSSYQIRAGVYRLVCSNGMVVGNDVAGMNIKHMGFEPQQVIDASFEVVDRAKDIARSIGNLKAIELSPKEQMVFGTVASELLFNETTRPNPSELVTTHRREDRGSLWGTFNAAQENWMRGKTYYNRKKDGKRVKNRAPKSIDGNVKLNQALWTLTEKMAELKTAG